MADKISYSIILVLLALTGCNTGDDEIYILPKNYIGVVYIIFNQKAGEQPKYEDGKRVYEIPLTGILKTQFAPNEGWHRLSEHYYVDKKKRIPIYYQLENRSIEQDKLQVCCKSDGESYKENFDAVVYERFFIGTKQQIDSVYEIEGKRDISKFGE